MKNLKALRYKFIFTAILSTGIYLNIHAQKLPNKQEISLYAPAIIKIDGKADEWDNKFQAYNNHTEFYYTISNDDSNLYLAIQATRADVIEKILAGAITLKIKGKNKAEMIDPLVLTYPNIDRMEKSTVVLLLQNKSALSDSVVQQANLKLSASSKEIKLSGFDRISDPEISIYNEAGIKTAETIGSKREWTYELAIPLKYLKRITDNSDGAFNYQLIINGVQLPGNLKILTVGGQLNGGGAPNSEAPLEFFSPTDLSATYTLMKNSDVPNHIELLTSPLWISKPYSNA